MKNCINGEKVNNKKVKQIGSKSFIGNINLQIESAEDHTQVDEFCLHLKKIDNLRISSYNWSEKKGLKIVISLKDAVPLGDVLRQMPLVGQVYKKKKDIAVVLITPVSDTTSPKTADPEKIVAC
jgi:hypothetical protein